MKCFYLNSSKDFSIEDETGKEYTIEEAKEEWSKIVAKNFENFENCNLAFERLVTFNWNLERVKEWYKSEG
jgi:hypothetical protein